ncbi:MAG: hypothetical protein Q7R66_04770 [Undibacterium sp.]|uniref:hypothetical protein n=1 Tax=Undibacterium sp. TaxID=1914977 RepID=UPI002721A089|nr:hypothetical protein [Undibacterium sp.]MDO8651482.1 hypothetical protein [Undibacterium sp.]
MIAMSDTAHQQQNWQPRRGTQRLTASLLATLITLFMLQQLNHRSSSHGVREITGQPSTLILLPFFSEKSPKVAAKIPSTNPAIVKRAKAAQLSYREKQTTAATNLLAPEVTTATTITNNTPAANNILSPTLQLDAKAIRKAYDDSKSDIQKMADASGKEMNTLASSKYDRFQTAVNQAAKPDCIGKDTTGAGLLAIPLIAFLAATDKCK